MSFNPSPSWASVVDSVLECAAHGGVDPQQATPGAQRVQPPQSFLAMFGEELQQQHRRKGGRSLERELEQYSLDQDWSALFRCLSVALPHSTVSSLFHWARLPSGDPLERHLISILLLFLAVVRNQSQVVYTALTRVSEEHQIRFREIFQKLLQAGDHLDRNVLESCLQVPEDSCSGDVSMNQEESSSSYASSSTASFCNTPKSTRSHLPWAARKHSSTVFSNSPGEQQSPLIKSKSRLAPVDVDASPLKEFLDSPVTKQLAKFQEIAQTHKRMTLDVRMELDQEKANCLGLQENLTQSKKQLGSLREELNKTRQELRGLESQPEVHATSDVQKMIEARRSKEMMIEQIELKLLEANTKGQTLEQELLSWKEKLQESRKGSQALETEVVTLKYEVGGKVQQISALEDALEDKQQQIDQLRVLVEELRSRNLEDSSCKSPNNTLENMGDILGADLQTKVAQLDEELQTVTDQLQKKEKLEEELTLSLKVEQEEKAQLREEVAATVQAKAEVTEQLSKKEEQLEALQEIVEGSKVECAEQKKELVSIQNQAEEEKLALTVAMENQIALSGQEKAALQEELALKNEEVQSLSTAMTAERQEREVEMEKHRSEEVRFESVREELNNRLEEQCVDTFNAKAQLCEKDERLEQLNSKLEKVREEAQSLEQELENQRSEMKSQSCEKEGQMEQIKAELKMARQANTDLEQEIKTIQETHRTEIEEANTQLGEKKAQCDQLDTELKMAVSEASSVREKASSDQQAQIDAKNEEIALLTESARKDLELEQARSAQIESDLENLKRQHEEAASKHGQLLSGKEEELLDLRNVVAQLESELSTLKGELAVAQNTLIAQQQQEVDVKSNLTSNVNDLLKAKAELEVSLAQSTAETVSARERYESLKADFDSQLTASKQELEEVHKASEETISSVRQELEQRNSELSQVRSKIEHSSLQEDLRLREETEKLEAQVAQNQETEQALLAVQEEARQGKAALSEAKKNLAEMETNYKLQLEQTEQETVSARERYESLKTDFDSQLTSSKQELEEVHKASEETISSMRQELEDKSSELSQVRSQIEHSSLQEDLRQREETEKLEAQVAKSQETEQALLAVQEEARQGQDALLAAKKDLAEMETNHQLQLEQLEQRCIASEERYIQMEARCQEKEVIVSGLEEETSSQRQQAEETISELRMQLQNSEQQDQETVKDLQSQISAKDEAFALLQETQKTALEQAQSLKSANTQLQHELDSTKQKLSAEHKGKEEKLRADLKTKYQTKLKDFSKAIEGKYHNKIEECQGKYQKEIAKLEVECKSLTQEKEDALQQAQETQGKLEKSSVDQGEFKELQKKYEASKKIMAQMKRELDMLKARKKEESAPSLMQPPKPMPKPKPVTVKKPVLKVETSDDAFAAPVNTPGRTRPGRTRSDLNLNPNPAVRKPPLPHGAGNLFRMDDEQGELFSNSYLTDMKSGFCETKSSNDPSRLSELSRRNTMLPAHLQSSYPAETQFFSSASFSDSDLRHGRFSDVHGLTEKTSQIKLGSPAFNTRSASSRTAPHSSSTSSSSSSMVPPPAPSGSNRKRRSQNFSAVGELGKNDFSTPPSVKRLRREVSLRKKEALHTSYSKPGLPTPAKGKRADVSMGSLNMSSASALDNSTTTDHAHDKTPLLDCTNTTTSTEPADTSIATNASNVSQLSSNRSLRKRFIGTPKSLKSVMTGAFKGRTKYSMKGQTKSNHV